MGEWSATSVRNVILFALCVQNAGYSLFRKYSMSTERVSINEVLLAGEVMKIVFASFMIMKNKEDDSDAQGKGLARLMWLVRHSSKMFVLAAIYGLMNILSFVALKYIGAGEFTIFAQLKILVTAAFSVQMLGTFVSWTQWRALALLMLGCLLVASPSLTNHHQGAHSSVSGLHLQIFGYVVVATEAVLSGFASIYFEKVVKSTTEKITIWERNFQLGMYSLIMYVCIVAYGVFIYPEEEKEGGLFANWSFLTFTVAIFGAVGGLLVAATLKYANAILKTLAVSGAIVLATLLGHFCLNGPLDLLTAAGGCAVILAIANYTFDVTPKPPPTLTELPKPT